MRESKLIFYPGTEIWLKVKLHNISSEGSIIEIHEEEYTIPHWLYI